MRRTLWARACAITSSRWHIRPRRVTKSESSVPAAPLPNSARSHDREAGSRRTASALVPGKTRPTSWNATCLGATGSSTDDRACRSPTYPATVTSTRAQPLPRQNSGSTTRTACTRPGGTVCIRVSISPYRSRRPSGERATVKLVCMTSGAITPRARPSSTGSAPARTPGSRKTRPNAQQADEQHQRADDRELEELGAEQGAEPHPPVRLLGRLGRLAGQPGGAGQQLGAQLLGHRAAEVAELRRRLVAAGQLDAHLGEAEHPAEQRAYDVDGLHAGQRHAAAAAPQDARLDHEVVAGDPELQRPPGPEPRDQRDDRDRQHDQHEPGDRARREQQREAGTRSA